MKQMHSTVVNDVEAGFALHGFASEPRIDLGPGAVVRMEAVNDSDESGACSAELRNWRGAHPVASARAVGARIAVLDPAMRTREYARRVVRRFGHHPVAFASAAEMARSDGPLAPRVDMVIMAVAKDAEASLLQLREVKALVGHRVPVLCLATRRQLPILSDLHWNAANEVIVRPASFVEFCSVARMFMRRSDVGVPEFDPTWDGYRFSLTSDVVEVSGERIHLRATDFDVALELFRHAGCTLSREWLYAAGWDKSEGTLSRSLDVSVSRLRRVLDLKAHGWSLRAVHGVGYRLDRQLARAPESCM